MKHYDLPGFVGFMETMVLVAVLTFFYLMIKD
jgi:hypothetical protein